MIGLTIHMNADGMLKGRIPDYHVKSGNMHIGVLEGGMKSGLPSVGIAFELPNGKLVLVETSLQLLLSAAKAFEVWYPHTLD